MAVPGANFGGKRVGSNGLNAHTSITALKVYDVVNHPIALFTTVTWLWIIITDSFRVGIT